jgi:chaperone modulatory protein CbpM
MTDTKFISGTIFDENQEITIVELSKVCSIDRKLIDDMIAEGILEPTDGGGDKARVPYSSVRATRTVIHLQRDLGVNIAGAALALDLLESIDNLRAQLRRRQ